jgi:hypothetical protein
MTLGFIILRHVNNRATDLYWKECYTCIRKYYDNPILIIDDSSNRDFLNENIFLKNCTVIYDAEHKGAAEMLPYYYFHKLKPFDTAVILHDSIFLQSKVNFELEEGESVRFLWSFRHTFDDEIFHLISALAIEAQEGQDLVDFFHQKDKWHGCFGVMSVIRWSHLDLLDARHQIFKKLLPIISCRNNRHALERVFAMIAYFNSPTPKQSFFGDIHSYIRWGITFSEYLTQDFSQYPVMKVWSGR